MLPVVIAAVALHPSLYRFAFLRKCPLQISKLEEAIKRLEGEAAQARGRALHLESNVRVKERELERLNRALEATRGSQAEAASAQLQAEELVRKLDGDLAQTQAKVKAGDSRLQGSRGIMCIMQSAHRTAVCCARLLLTLTAPTQPCR